MTSIQNFFAPRAGINVLSLFDGISCARVALQTAGIRVGSYWASEIDSNAIKVSKSNFPQIQHVGSVKDLLLSPGRVDLLIGGSPCQDCSIAKKDRKGLAGDKSSLFWEYVRIKEITKPKWFVLENVASMSKADQATISEALGVKPVMFNASLVSAQSRKRLFWTNIPFSLPKDAGISLNSILQPQVSASLEVKGNLTACGSKTKTDNLIQIGFLGKNSQGYRVYNPVGKSTNLTASSGGLGGKTGLYQISGQVRKLSPVECERLQGVPDEYTRVVADTSRYKALGNAFNANVVAHILRGIKA